MTLQQLFKVAGAAVRLIGSGQTDELRHVVRNRWKGLDLEFTSLEELGLSPENAEPHSASRAPALRRVFKTVGVPPGSVLLDLGSGKGGALAALASLPFQELVGVEIAPELIAIATSNMARLGIQNARFVASDAGAFTGLDRVTHVYLFNPFPCPVVARVMENLQASLGRAPRDLCLVYRRPVCDDVVMASGLFVLDQELRPDALVWRVYRHKARETGERSQEGGGRR